MTVTVVSSTILNLGIIYNRTRFFLMKENVISQLELNVFAKGCMPSPGDIGQVPVLIL